VLILILHDAGVLILAGNVLHIYPFHALWISTNSPALTLLPVVIALSILPFWKQADGRCAG